MDKWAIYPQDIHSKLRVVHRFIHRGGQEFSAWIWENLEVIHISTALIIIINPIDICMENNNKLGVEVA
ncbi:hypothetical protein [Rubrobacter xylanophilus]|uniref:hypothetical protein n=1 Tax=Rubrobacter xylanophilus TaxID=49319 RepID=UPI001C63E4DA|nr:hypothetical protein [Rubrobacter xylanophilus]